MPKPEAENKERIFRKTEIKEIIEKTFTTGRKPKLKSTININRKGNIVKERCRQLTEIALNLFPKRIISHEDLAFLVKGHIGGNRDTVRDYMGYDGRVISNSFANTKRLGIRRKGYLEIFGFMHRQGRNWIIHAQTTLHGVHSPPSASPFPNIDECLVRNHSIKKISLSYSGSDYTEDSSLANGESDSVEVERRERDTERERNFTPYFLGDMCVAYAKDKYGKLDENLVFLEQLADPKNQLDSEPDFARKKCPKIKWDSK